MSDNHDVELRAWADKAREAQAELDRERAINKELIGALQACLTIADICGDVPTPATCKRYRDLIARARSRSAEPREAHPFPQAKAGVAVDPREMERKLNG